MNNISAANSNQNLNKSTTSVTGQNNKSAYGNIGFKTTYNFKPKSAGGVYRSVSPNMIRKDGNNSSIKIPLNTIKQGKVYYVNLNRPNKKTE